MKTRVTPVISRDEMRRDRLKHYRDHRNSVGEQLLRAVLRNAATIDAAQTTNLVLERMGLLDLEIVVDEVMGTAVTTLRAEVTAIIAQHAHLPRAAKHEMVERIVARMVPLRDNVPVRGPTAAENALSRTESLEGALRREAENLSKS